MMAGTSGAEVRFVDTSLDAPALDVYLNGSGAAYNLGYATFSSYVPVSAGTCQFNANRASTGQALVSGKAMLAGGHQYTVIVGNRLSDLQQHVYPDALPAAVPGTVAVRVLNEIAGGPVDVYLVSGAGSLAAASPLVTNLGYGVNNAYVRVPAGPSFAVYVAPAGSSPLMAAALKVSGASVSGVSGAARTLVLTEAAARDGKGVYGIVLNDAEP